MDNKVPGILIAGTHSGVGKTTTAAGIMAALRKRGMKVQPFKVGPDYIDPSYHTLACGRPCRNLDNWMAPEAALKELYARAVASADIVVIEGVMGLFDGRSGLDGAGSSAEIAKLLGMPVLLVLDVSKMARSAAALALGYSRFDPKVRIAGVIVNRVGTPAHLRMVTEAIEREAGLPVVGHLPRREGLELPERHLGLIPATEGILGNDFLEQLLKQIEEGLDLDTVLRLAREAEPLDSHATGLFPEPPRPRMVTIAVAQDEAFCFYYQDNLDLLSAWGAELAPFSPLRDSGLPEGTQGIYLGGGFPELFPEPLSANKTLLAAVRRAHSLHMPIYAECGGLMYLCESLRTQERSYPMAGLIPARAVMQPRRTAMGYTRVLAGEGAILLKKGQEARGHEFHWSCLETPLDESSALYEVLEDGRLEPLARREGYRKDNLAASYIHLHFASHPEIAPNFVASCVHWAGRL
ncbi:MAG: cobyrinate a,c-diamide synthase [Armatimonadetes bacterium]|nr:cobyrinate a,c-diamide synthase [Armatimonadota bacterium]